MRWVCHEPHRHAAAVSYTHLDVYKRQFLAYLTSDAAQTALITTNWMYPANTPAAGLPAGFETLIQPGKSLLMSSDEAGAGRAKAIEEWQTALSK